MVYLHAASVRPSIQHLTYGCALKMYVAGNGLTPRPVASLGLCADASTLAGMAAPYLRGQCAEAVSGLLDIEPQIATLEYL